MSLANAVLFGGLLGTEPKWRGPDGKKKLFVSLFLVQNNGIWPNTVVTVTCTGKTAEYVQRVIKPQIGDAISVEGHLGNPAKTSEDSDKHAIVIRASNVFLTYPGKRREGAFFVDAGDLDRDTLTGADKDLV